LYGRAERLTDKNGGVRPEQDHRQECDSGDCATLTATSSACIEGVSETEALWSDRDYAWVEAPADILSGAWTCVILLLRFFRAE
jgi:hypothetical protein